MPTRSDALPMMDFSSPLLSSVDRLLRGFESRFSFDGASSWLGRMDRFTDRFFTRRLSSLGLIAGSPVLGFQPRDSEPASLTAAESWIPAAADLRREATPSVSRPGQSPAFPTQRGTAARPSMPVVAPLRTGESGPSPRADVATEPSRPVTAAGASTFPSQASLGSPTAPGAPAAPVESSVAGIPRPVETTSSMMEPVGLVEPVEPQVRDLLRTASDAQAQRTANTLATPRVSALGRAFQHLGFSDARLGLVGRDPLQSLFASPTGEIEELRSSSLPDAPRSTARVAQAQQAAQQMVTPDAVAAIKKPAASTARESVAPVREAEQTVAQRSPSVAAPSEVTRSTGTTTAVAPVDSRPIERASESLQPGSDSLSGLSTPDNRALAAARAPSEVSSISTPADEQVPDSQSRIVAIPTPARRAVPRAAGMGSVVPSLWSPFSPSLAPSVLIGETAAAELRTGGPVAESTALPSPARPWSAPGAVGARSEQFTSRVGLPTQQLVPTTSSPRTLAAWSQAPGVPSQLTHLLAQHAESAVRREQPSGLARSLDRVSAPSDAGRSMERFGSPSLPFVPPTEARQRSTDATIGQMSARPLASASASASQTAPLSSALRQAAVAPTLVSVASSQSLASSADLEPSIAFISRDVVPSAETPSRTSSSAADGVGAAHLDARIASSAPASSSSPSRPWLAAGGMATLAELFAAGVGLSSGGAQRPAESLGLSFVPSMVPSWLPVGADGAERAAPSMQTREPARERISAQLPYLPSASLEPAAQPVRSQMAAKTPSLASTRTDQPELTVRVGASPVTERLAAEPVPMGLPALAAAIFGSSASPSRDGATPSERGSSLLAQIGALGARSEAFARDHGVARSEELSARMSADSALGLNQFPTEFVANGAEPPKLRRRADRTLERPDATSPTVSGPARRAEASAAALDVPSSIAGSLPGATALRSEHLANQFALSLLGATSASPRAWRGAPGLPSEFASAVQQTQSLETPSRWAMGPRGLLFVSEPMATPQSAQSSQRQSVSNRTLPASQSFGAVPSGIASARGSEPLRSAAVQTTEPSVPADASALSSGRSSWTDSSSLASLPWLRLGGMGALAELFAASVGAGTGAAASVAQSLGVSAGRSFWPAWLRQLDPSTATPALLERFAAALPSLVLPPSVESATSQARPAGTLRTATPRPLDAAVPFASSPLPRAAGFLTGGLAATAESFAKQHGIEHVSTAGELGLSSPTSREAVRDESSGHWLSVSGGMVFVPREPSATRESDPVARAQKGPSLAAKPAASTAAKAPVGAPTATPTLVGPGSPLASFDFGRLGGLGLRSELFSSLLGPQSGSGSDVSQARTGWEDIVSLFTSLPRSSHSTDAEMVSPTPRLAFRGSGGLVYLGSPQQSQAQARGSLSSTVRPQAARESGRPSQPALGGLPSLVAAQPGSISSTLGTTQQLTSRLVDKNLPTERASAHLASPLLSLVAAPSVDSASPRGVSDVQRAFGSRLLTGFPRIGQRGEGADAPTALWPKTTMQQVQRIEKVLSQLPVEWQPSTKVVAAVRQSGIALTPLWQELPNKLNQIKPYETVEPPASHGESSSQFAHVASAAAQRTPAMSMVGPTGPKTETAREERNTETARQQAVEKAMQDAVTSMIKSGGQAAASARLLEAIRSHSMPSPTRTDERMSLGDLSLIALSMGEQRIAASSPDHPKDRLEPNVSMALRMKKWKHVEDDKNSYRKTVTEHAEQVLKHMKSQMDQAKQRGQF